MTPSIASLVLHIITGVGLLVWLLGLRQFLLCLRERSGENLTRREDPGSGPVDMVEGGVELEGDSAELCNKAAALLANQTNVLGPFRITDKQPDRIGFEGVETYRGRARNRIRRGELHFSAAGTGRTQASFWAETHGAGSLLVASGTLLLLGLVALCCGYFLMRTYVVPNPSSSVRGQTFQMLHVAHLLWPTFLGSSLYRRSRRAARQGFEALLSNLPYAQGFPAR